MSKNYRPGQIVPTSGQAERYHNGRPTKKEVTVTKGEPFPPTPQKGDTYKIVDKTKH